MADRTGGPPSLHEVLQKVRAGQATTLRLTTAQRQQVDHFLFTASASLLRQLQQAWPDLKTRTDMTVEDLKAEYAANPWRAYVREFVGRTADEAVLLPRHDPGVSARSAAGVASLPESLVFQAVRFARDVEDFKRRLGQQQQAAHDRFRGRCEAAARQFSSSAHAGAGSTPLDVRGHSVTAGRLRDAVEGAREQLKRELDQANAAFNEERKGLRQAYAQVLAVARESATERSPRLAAEETRDGHSYVKDLPQFFQHLRSAFEDAYDLGIVLRRGGVRPANVGGLNTRAQLQNAAVALGGRLSDVEGQKAAASREMFEAVRRYNGYAGRGELRREVPRVVAGTSQRDATREELEKGVRAAFARLNELELQAADLRQQMAVVQTFGSSEFSVPESVFQELYERRGRKEITPVRLAREIVDFAINDPQGSRFVRSQADTEPQTLDWQFRSGQYAGFRISEVPVEYVIWVSRGGEIERAFNQRRLTLQGRRMKLPPDLERVTRTPTFAPDNEIVRRCREYLRSDEGQRRARGFLERNWQKAYDEPLRVLVGQVPELEDLSRRVHGARGERSGDRRPGETPQEFLARWKRGDVRWGGVEKGSAQAKEMEAKAALAVRQRGVFGEVYPSAYARAYEEAVERTPLRSNTDQGLERERARMKERWERTARSRALKEYRKALEDRGLSDFQYYYRRALEEGFPPDEAQWVAKGILKDAKSPEFETPAGFRDTGLTPRMLEDMTREERKYNDKRNYEYLLFVRQASAHNDPQEGRIDPRVARMTPAQYEEWADLQFANNREAFERLRQEGRLPAWARNREFSRKNFTGYEVWRLGKIAEYDAGEGRIATDFLLPGEYLYRGAPANELDVFSHQELSRIDPKWRSRQVREYMRTAKGAALHFSRLADELANPRSLSQVRKAYRDIRRLLDEDEPAVQWLLGVARQRYAALRAAGVEAASTESLNASDRSDALERLMEYESPDDETADEENEFFDAGEGEEEEEGAAGTPSGELSQEDAERRVAIRGDWQEDAGEEGEALSARWATPEEALHPERQMEANAEGWDESVAWGSVDEQAAASEGPRRQDTAPPAPDTGDYPDSPADYSGPGRRIAKGLPPA